MAKKKRTNAPPTKQYAKSQMAQNIAYSPFGKAVFDWDTEKLSPSTCREMRERDETVASGLEFLTYNVLNSIGSFTHENSDIQDFVNNNISSITGGLKSVLRDALMDGITFGYHVSEILWKIDNGKAKISDFVSLKPENITFVTNNSATKITYIMQTPLNGNPIKIPADKCFIYSHNLSSNPYGESAFKRIYRPYKFKESIVRFWAIALEKFGMPIVVGKSMDSEGLLDSLKSMYSAAGIAISPEDEVSILESNRPIGEVFERATLWADKMIYRGLLLPQLLVTTGSSGSYALGQVHLSMFLTAVKWIAKELTDAFIDSAVKKMIDYNFGVQENYGQFEISTQPSSQERQQLANMFYNLVNAGVLDPVADGKMIRNMLKLPKEVNKNGTKG